ncbi:hypothetical protein SELSPUOL_02228 [Selenomonas sputigena ATCC 35185]|uniref:Uncharacterized protein n=1 Tax=Selenomonas sputigena (strain ATCC 35185 / DSM 20758 / CCUG 44933 / VPI D19B-28) TaxID=546271 RepID=C9LXM0_SELS3|nr:hypothetical protein SELSPUOL_02228 [Selenomonas sputigena ATCC 35185]
MNKGRRPPVQIRATSFYQRFLKKSARLAVRYSGAGGFFPLICDSSRAP